MGPHEESYMDIARRVRARLEREGKMAPLSSLSSLSSQPQPEKGRLSRIVPESSSFGVDPTPLDGSATKATKATNGKTSKDEGRPIWLRAMGEVLDHPRLEFDWGRAILPAKEAWEKFADRAPTADMALAVAVLLMVDATGSTAGSDAPGGRNVDSFDG